MKELKIKLEVIKERVELLAELNNDIQGEEGVPMVKLGGLVDDLFMLNPFTSEQIIPLLKESYEAELQAVNCLIANQN